MFPTIIAANFNKMNAVKKTNRKNNVHAKAMSFLASPL